MENQTANKLYAAPAQPQQQTKSNDARRDQTISAGHEQSDFADSLYAPQESSPQVRRRTTNEPAADETPQQRIERSEAELHERANMLYSDSTEDISGPFGLALGDDRGRLADLGFSPEDIASHIQEVAEAASQLNLSPTQFGPIHSHITYFVEQAIRGKITPEMSHEWAIESMKAAREKFGEREAAERLEYAKQFAQQSKLADRELWEAGLGNYPPVVLALMEHAPDAIKSGRFKTKRSTGQRRG